MNVNETSLWIISIVIVLSTPFITDMVGGSMVVRSEILTEEDRVITSLNYPKPYPPNHNFTWMCSSTATKWAVVFLDFQLDSPEGNFREYDWLELDDGRKPLRYSSSSQPHWPYKSSGHYLRMTFITDSVSGGKARGFKVQLLHGKDDQEIAVKIHALKSAESAEDDGDNELLLIIVTVAAAILFMVIVIAALLCFLYHRRVSSRTLTLTDRDAFGVRRNSGVYHSRDSGSRDHHTSEVVIVARHTHRVPPESQQSSQTAPVQRSNSQRDWRARAELCAMLTVSAQNSRPNMYSHSGPEPEACRGREPDKVPDFNSFDDCCRKSRKNSKGGDCHNDGCSTARKSNPYHLNNNLAAQNPSANQSACASLSKVAAEKKCNNNDYTNLSFSKETNFKFPNEGAENQEPGSPVYCNSPVSSPTSPGFRDGFMLNVSVESLDTGPVSPTDNCYENISACQSQTQERLDKNLKTKPLHMNSPDDTQVKRKNSYGVNCQRARQDDESKAMSKSQGDSKCLRSDGLENILEVKRNRPPSVNLYSNWENIQKDGQEPRMCALPETKTMVGNSSSPSRDFEPKNTGDCSLTPCMDMQKPEEKRVERKISDPNGYQMNTKVPRANTPLCSTDVKSNDISRDISHSVPCNEVHEPKKSLSPITRQFTLELPAVNTGDYLYLTECGISPHKPEKEWDKKEVSFADTHQTSSREPKLSTSQSISSDEGEYRLIPSTHERGRNEESTNAMTLELNSILPTTHLSLESNPNNSGEYHLLPLDNDKNSHGVESAAGAISAKQSMDAMELQLNAKVPKPNNISLSSPANSGEYHFLPTSHATPRPIEENELNMKVSPPNSLFPPPEMKDNSKEGEYHYLFPCNQIHKNDPKCREADIPELGNYELGTAVPTVSSPSAVENPNDYYVVPKANKNDLDGQNGHVKFPNLDGYQLTSAVPISKELHGNKTNNCGEYHYVATTRNNEADTSQKRKAEEAEIPKMNTYQLDVEVPRSCNALTTNDVGEYDLVPIRN